MILTRRIHISIVLIVVLSWLISGCSAPETAPPASPEETTERLDSPAAAVETPATAPTASSTAEPTQESGQTNASLATAPADPSPTIEMSATIPAPVISELQEIRFLNTVSAWFTSAEEINPSAYESLAGPTLVALAIQPRLFEMLNQSSNTFEERVAAFLAYLESLDEETKIRLSQQAIEDFHLTEGSPALVGFAYTNATSKYDTATGKTRLTIPILEPFSDLVLNDWEGKVSINAPSINPQTLEEEMIQIPVESAVLEKPETSLIFSQELVLTFPGNALRWTKITMEPGVFSHAEDGPLAGHFFFTRGLTGADAVMAMRALSPDEIAKQQLLHSLAYGGQPEQYLPAIPETQIAEAVHNQALQTINLHVEAGDITQEEADAIFQRFENDPELAGLHPVYKAALQIALVFKSMGGDRVVDSALGQNHSEFSVRLLFESDTEELNDLFDGNPPSLNGGLGLLWQLPDPNTPKGYINIYIISDRLKTGEEPIQIAAAQMIHEMMVHDRYEQNQWNSIAEEVFGNLIETLIWAKMIQADPALAFKGTSQTKFLNLRLMVLLNSQNPARLRNFETGLLSEQAPPDYNALPGNRVPNMPIIRGFVDFMHFIHDGQGHTPALVSFGSENIRHILISMFGSDDPQLLQEINALDLDNDKNPEMSENFIRFLDRNLHRVFSNEEALKTARLMGLEVESGTP